MACHTQFKHELLRAMLQCTLKTQGGAITLTPCTVRKPGQDKKMDIH